jgi:hypothetical protein
VSRAGLRSRQDVLREFELNWITSDVHETLSGLGFEKASQNLFEHKNRSEEFRGLLSKSVSDYNWDFASDCLYLSQIVPHNHYIPFGGIDDGTGSLAFS